MARVRTFFDDGHVEGDIAKVTGNIVVVETVIGERTWKLFRHKTRVTPLDDEAEELLK